MDELDILTNKLLEQISKFHFAVKSEKRNYHELSHLSEDMADTLDLIESYLIEDR